MKEDLLESIKKLDLSRASKKEDLDMDSMLKSLQESKINAIHGMLDDINNQIRNRTILDKEILTDIERLKTQMNNAIMEISSSFGGQSNPEAARAIADLRKKSIEIAELSMTEKLNFWRDTAALQKELRDHNKELIDIESKENILDNLI
jgi:hypothetical protein